jgi:hypothetical protein
MLNHRSGLRGIALIALLAGGGLLEAQVPTPHIGLIASSLQTFSEETEGGACLGATNGPAITVNSPGIGAGICMYITGNFTLGDSETVTWTDSINGMVTLNSPANPTATSVVAIVPAYLLAVAETATIQVNEAPITIFVVPADPASNTATFTVNPAMTNPATLPSGIVGVAYSQPFFAGGTAGTGGFTVSGPISTVSAPEVFPPGLNYTDTAGYLLTGTPTTAGTAFPLSVTITDSWQNVLSVNETITIFSRLVITTASLPNGRINTAYTPLTLTATGGVMPYTWTPTGLPAGMTLAPGTGVLSGTPTVSGPFTVGVTLTDSSGQTANASFPLEIVPTLVITTANLPNGRINTAYTPITLTGAGGLTPYTWTATGLPAGITLAAGTGVLSGTPTASGPFTVAVTLTDNSTSGQTANASFPLEIVPTLVITTANLPNGRINTAYTPITLTGAGGLTPYTWTATVCQPV